MRAALVGVGRFGRHYLQTLATLPAIELVAVASRNPDTAALLPPGCARFDHWRPLLANCALDALLVVTPPRSHADIVAAAVARGLAVLVEKPLTLDPREAGRLLALRPSAPVMVEHTHLFSPAFAKLRAEVAGTVVHVDVDAGGPGPWRKDVPVLWDWGAHWVAACLDLVGSPPRRVSCALDDERRVEDGIGQSVRLRLEFDRCVAEVSLSNLLAAPQRRLGVSTAGGEQWLYDELAATPLSVSSSTGAARGVAVSDERPLRAALRALHAAWRAWRAGEACSPRSDLALGAEVVAVLSRCEAALRMR